MPALAIELRRRLEKVVTEARDRAEEAARAALRRLAVEAAKPFDADDTGAKASYGTGSVPEVAKRATAAGRTGLQEIDQLTQELAYEYWHRMLFARFLAENHLLMHPDGVAVTLAECEELARTGGGTRTASSWRPATPARCCRKSSAPTTCCWRSSSRSTTVCPWRSCSPACPPTTFTADDSLGWVYQFWQAKKKDEVNKSGEKIDGRTLPAVTQLFTEHYMVQFLLHNTIGAWWCARHGIQGPPGGAGVPAGQAPVAMEYLRWRDDGTPAAGTFEGWPKTLAEFTMLDPCCGSGHFLVAAFHLLVPLRMHDEGLSAQRRLRRRAAGEPLRPRTRPPLHPDRGVRPGPGGVEVPRRGRSAPRLPPAAAAEHRLLGPGRGRVEGGLDRNS